MSARLPPTRDEVAGARRLLGIHGRAGRSDVLSAWKAALRLSHPDRAAPQERELAEERAKEINRAKQTLIEALERGFPDGMAPPVPRPTRTPATSQPAGQASRRSASPSRHGSPAGHRGCSSPGQAKGGSTPTRPSTMPTGPQHVQARPTWRPADGRWLPLASLVVAGLLAFSIVALTQGDSGTSGSRIEPEEDLAEERLPVDPVPTSPPDATATNPSAELGAEPDAATFLLAAHTDPDATWLANLVHPRARVGEVGQIIARLADESVPRGLVELASQNIECDLGGGPGTGQSRCEVQRPDGLVADMEFRRDGDGWKLMGYWRGG